MDEVAKIEEKLTNLVQMGNITISRNSGPQKNQNSPMQQFLKQKFNSMVNAGNITPSQIKQKPFPNKGQNSFTRTKNVKKTVLKQPNDTLYSLPKEGDLTKGFNGNVTNHQNYIESNIKKLNMKRHSQIVLESKYGYLECDSCDKKFSYEKVLERHIQKEHKVPKSTTTDLTNPMCDSCGKVFSKKKYIKRHIRMVHEGQKWPKRRPRICDLCGDTFKSNLKRHIHVVHNGHRDYTCPTCGKDFTMDQTMKRHILGVHEGRRPHKCSNCDKAFLTSTKLKHHILHVHEGHKDYICNFCPKAYSTAQMLRRHTSKNHTNQTNLNKSNNTQNDNVGQKPLSIKTEL